MSELEEESAITAWCDAAIDLGIRVIAPYPATDVQSSVARWIAFVPDFGSRTGMLVKSLVPSPGHETPGSAGVIFSLDLASFARYDRHEWIDLLEGARWFGVGAPPAWYTAVSPWHHDPATLHAIAGELARIFGRSTHVEDAAPYRRLDLLPRDEVLAFLRRVPAGTSLAAFERWTVDVADAWEQTHRRRLSNER